MLSRLNVTLDWLVELVTSDPDLKKVIGVALLLALLSTYEMAKEEDYQRYKLEQQAKKNREQ